MENRRLTALDEFCRFLLGVNGCWLLMANGCWLLMMLMVVGC